MKPVYMSEHPDFSAAPASLKPLLTRSEQTLAESRELLLEQYKLDFATYLESLPPDKKEEELQAGRRCKKPSTGQATRWRRIKKEQNDDDDEDDEVESSSEEDTDEEEQTVQQPTPSSHKKSLSQEELKEYSQQKAICKQSEESPEDSDDEEEEG
ncbi:hypothetical protein B566_EDAN012498 [Ephemera danica]|nr:hypothetical protein B566_EDAN012498 [Ephemera danica]